MDYQTLTDLIEKHKQAIEQFEASKTLSNYNEVMTLSGNITAELDCLNQKLRNEVPEG